MKVFQFVTFTCVCSQIALCVPIATPEPAVKPFLPLVPRESNRAWVPLNTFMPRKPDNMDQMVYDAFVRAYDQIRLYRQREIQYSSAARGTARTGAERTVEDKTHLAAETKLPAENSRIEAPEESREMRATTPNE
jgi:hypothetical protein